MRGRVEIENLAIRHVKFWTHSSCSWSARSNLILLVSSSHTLKAMLRVSSKFYWSIPKLPASREQSSDWAFSSEWGPFNVEFELPQCGAVQRFYLSLSLYCSDLCSQTYSSDEVKRGKMPRQSFHTCVSSNFHKFSWKLPVCLFCHLWITWVLYIEGSGNLRQKFWILARSTGFSPRSKSSDFFSSTPRNPTCTLER